MKLFKSLLVAPAALGLLSPLAASASETNLNGISTYSDVDSIEFANSFGKDESSDKQLIAGGEGLVTESSYDGGFSETTTASFSTDMYLGSVDGGTASTDDAVMAAYSFQIDLSTSFTGEDSLDIAIDAGNSGIAGTVEFDGNGNGDTLQVDGISYTFPVGTSITAFVGDNVDGSLLFNTACVYGGPSNTLDDCGNNYSAINAGGGTAFGAVTIRVMVLLMLSVSQQKAATQMVSLLQRVMMHMQHKLLMQEISMAFLLLMLIKRTQHLLEL